MDSGSPKQIHALNDGTTGSSPPRWGVYMKIYAIRKISLPNQEFLNSCIFADLEFGSGDIRNGSERRYRTTYPNAASC